jgi:hypothetical protein
MNMRPPRSFHTMAAIAVPIIISTDGEVSLPQTDLANESKQVRNSLMQRVTRGHRADFDVVIWELILESQCRF